MPDETKGNDQPSPVEAGGNAAPERPATPAPPAKPAVPPAAKPAAPAAAAPPKAAVPPKAPVPTPQPWESALVTRLKGQYGSGIREASTYLGQNYFVVDPTILTDILRILRDDERYDYCVDVTAVHYPKREEAQFEVIWILYSFAHNTRLRVKTQIKEGQEVPSSVPLWPTANWLEREVFDMFGIQFTGHPDMRRILLPEGWKGHPLRKDYDILLQDKEWVQINLGIESGQ